MIIFPHFYIALDLCANYKGRRAPKTAHAFLAYVDAWHEVNCESNLDSFIMGFRLGAAFTYDTFVSTEAPFTGFSES